MDQIFSFILVFGASIAALFILFSIISSHGDRTQKIAFLIFLVMLIIWKLSLSAYYDPLISYSGLQIMGKINFISGLIFMYAFTLFCFTFKEKDFLSIKNIPRIIFLITFCLFLLIFLLLFTKLIVAEELIVDNTLRSTMFGPLYYLYLIFILVTSVFGFYSLIKNYKDSRKFMKTKIKFMFASLLLSAIPLSITNIILPLFGNFSLQNIAVIFTAPFIITCFILIVRYRLFSPKLIFIKSIAYLIHGILFAVILFVFFEILKDNYSSLSPEVVVIFLVFSTLSILAYEKVKGFLTENIVGKFLFNGKNINASQVLNLYNTEISPLIKFQDIIDHTNNFLNQYFLCGIRLITMDDNYFQIYKELMGDEYTVNWMSEKFDRLDKNDVQILYRIGNSSVIEIFTQNAVDRINSEQIQYIDMVINSMLVATQRIDVVRKTTDLNNYLEKEVQKKTAELVNANVKLQEADKKKSEFLSIASHQLRTPVATLIGYTDGLKSGDFGNYPQELSPIVSSIHQSAVYLGELVNDFLNVTKIEDGKLAIVKTPFSVSKLVHECYLEIKDRIEGKGLKFLTNIDIPENIVAELDLLKTKQCIMNLLDNATKYTSKGYIRYESFIKDDIWTFIVEDTGIGISEEYKQRMFQKFSRAPEASKMVPDGSGIGLYLVKNIIDLQGGNLSVESEIGKGTRFTASFKLHSS